MHRFCDVWVFILKTLGSLFLSKHCRKTTADPRMTTSRWKDWIVLHKTWNGLNGQWDDQHRDETTFESGLFWSGLTRPLSDNFAIRPLLNCCYCNGCKVQSGKRGLERYLQSVHNTVWLPSFKPLSLFFHFWNLLIVEVEINMDWWWWTMWCLLMKANENMLETDHYKIQWPPFWAIQISPWGCSSLCWRSIVDVEWTSWSSMILERFLPRLRRLSLMFYPSLSFPQQISML